jgi:hypothetical protein
VENAGKSVDYCGKQKAKGGKLPAVDEGRKRVLLIAASIIAARRLAQEERVNDSPRTRFTISEAVAWADRILREIDRKWPTR